MGSDGLVHDVEAFVTEHRPHDAPTGDATEPTEKGYMVTVARPDGVTFMRWVTPMHATEETLGARLQPGVN